MSRITVVCLSFICVLSAFNANAKVYKWVDSNGQMHYTQNPPPNDGKTKATKTTTLNLNNRQRISGDVNIKYCSQIRKYAVQVATISLRGASINDVNSYMSRYDDQLKKQLNIKDPIFKQVTAYVYGLGRINPEKAGTLVYDQCMSGGFGGAEASGSGKNNYGASGTGWVVSSGHIVTNHHVVGDNKNVDVVLSNGNRLKATVVAIDRASDLALLSVKRKNALPDGLPLSSNISKLGTEVFTIGYPHPDVMGSKPKLTTGVISSVNGIRDDPRTYQISVPVQSGNSGGPLISYDGEVVGVVVAKLSAVKMFNSTGDLPQNVNYAVKIRYLRSLIARNQDSAVELTTRPRGNGKLSELAQRFESSVVFIKVK